LVVPRSIPIVFAICVYSFMSSVARNLSVTIARGNCGRLSSL
jgi:hypothetical protein